MKKLNSFIKLIIPLSLGVFFIYLTYENTTKEDRITIINYIKESNIFYVFILVSFIGFLTFNKLKQVKNLIIYLILLSIILEILHLIIPLRSFQWSDLFGNLLGVIVVIFSNILINKYEEFKK